MEHSAQRSGSGEDTGPNRASELQRVAAAGTRRGKEAFRNGVWKGGLALGVKGQEDVKKKMLRCFNMHHKNENELTWHSG